MLGPIAPSSLGFTLPHEHVMVDFVGAQKTGRDRWKPDEVVARMQPFLLAAKRRGVRGFVDCTPAYVGRDPRILKRLAQNTGLHILTNTGYYGDAEGRYLPPSAKSETAAQIAWRWLAEWRDGIEDTGIRPGFIKTRVDGLATDRSRLSQMDGKLLAAAAAVSRETQMAVTCHSPGPSGLSAALRFAAEGGDPGGFAQRRFFGRYLGELLDEAVELGRTTLVHASAIRARRTNGRWSLELDDSSMLEAAAIALAIGNQEPEAQIGRR